MNGDARKRTIESTAEIAVATALIASMGASAMAAERPQESGVQLRNDSYVEQRGNIAVQQPGPHEGKGTTTAYPFFEQAEGFDIVFRERVLHRGATIGEHRNDKDEIYYVLSGRGELLLDGKVRAVRSGDAILTRRGSTHALAQAGAEDLVIVVVYRKPSIVTHQP